MADSGTDRYVERKDHAQPMISGPRTSRSRAAAAAVACLAVGGILASCSSDTDADGEAMSMDAPTAMDSPHGSSATPETIDPVAYPADEADSAGITAVIDEYFTTTNAQDADGFRAILCAPLQSEYADLENEGPVPDPMSLDEVTDIAVDADTATANITYSVSPGSGSATQTAPFKFSRENGEWKVCGSPE